MAVFLVLTLVSLLARVIGWLGADYVDSWRGAIAVGMSAMFVMTGVAHFVRPLRTDMIAIVPPRLPAPALLVTVTGLLELLGAAGLLVPATRTVAAVCLLLLMLAMFPANIYAARMPHPPASMTARLSVRSALEAVFLAAAVVVAAGGIQ